MEKKLGSGRGWDISEKISRESRIARRRRVSLTTQSLPWTSDPVEGSSSSRQAFNSFSSRGSGFFPVFSIDSDV